MLLNLLLVLALAAPPGDLVDAALARFAAVTSYRVTLQSGRDPDAEVIRYFYKKPGYVRMEFVRPHPGAILAYDPTTRMVHLRPFAFSTSFVLTLRPDSSLLQSARGHRVDQSDLGALLSRVKRLKDRGTLTVLGEEAVAGRPATVVEVEGETGFAVEEVHRYRLWLDAASRLPLRAAAYGVAGNLVEEVLMEDLAVDVPLDASLFRL